MQSYGSRELDASVLLMPLVGFLPASDPRVSGTVAAIERYMTIDGLVVRYSGDPAVDGLAAGEGSFLPCSFWLAENLALLGRRDDASRLFERLLSVRNDLGLLSEEYETRSKRLVGNFPQALSHTALVNTAFRLARGMDGRPEARQDDQESAGVASFHGQITSRYQALGADGRDDRDATDPAPGLIASLCRSRPNRSQ